MKTYPDFAPRRARHLRVPAFVPVPQRKRSDGWTTERQARFLVVLARTQSVSAAARAVGMARETAYRLRKARGGESFAAAWDAVLGRVGPKRKVTIEERIVRAFGGLAKPMVWRGAYAGIAWKADNSALLGHIGQLTRGEGRDWEGEQRSQSFDEDFASTDGALRQPLRGCHLPASGEDFRGTPRGTPGRSRTGAPFQACKGAGPTGGIRR